MTIDPEYGAITSVGPGETVWDDLTGTNARVLRVEADEFGNIGVWLENDYLGGGRFPWEISPPIERISNTSSLVAAATHHPRNPSLNE